MVIVCWLVWNGKVDLMYFLEVGVEGGIILDYKIIWIILRYMKLFGKLVIFVDGWGGIVRVFKCFVIMIMF